MSLIVNRLIAATAAVRPAPEDLPNLVDTAFDELTGHFNLTPSQLNLVKPFLEGLKNGSVFTPSWGELVSRFIDPKVVDVAEDNDPLFGRGENISLSLLIGDLHNVVFQLFLHNNPDVVNVGFPGEYMETYSQQLHNKIGSMCVAIKCIKGI